MKAIVLETHNGEAVLLRDDGEIIKLRISAQVGEQVELPDAPIQLPAAKQPWLRTAIAASLAIAIGAGTYTYLSVPASAYVSLDAGEKSVELAVNRLGRIVSVQPKNKASIEMASKLAEDVQGKQVNAAIKQTVQTLQSDGALKGEESYLIAGVTANAPTTETEITQIVEETTSVTQEAPVEIYTITVTDEERQEAEKTEQSAGSYAFDNREEESDTQQRDELRKKRREERRAKRKEARRKKRKEERRKKRQEQRQKEEATAELQTETPVQTEAPVQTEPTQTNPVETTENVETVETTAPAEATTESVAEQPTEQQPEQQAEEQVSETEDLEGDVTDADDAPSSDDPEKEQKKQERKERHRKQRRKKRKEQRKKARQAKKNATNGEQSEAPKETDGTDTSLTE